MPANVMKKPILLEFFYDVVSPYSWLAFEVLCRYRILWNIDLKLQPFFLGGIMKETGNKPPAFVSSKAVYMNRDLERLGNYFKVPVSLTEGTFDAIFKKGSLQAQRFITAIDLVHPEHTENLSRALWMRMYNTHEDITEPDSFKQAAKTAGISDVVINDALLRIGKEETKQKLIQTTQKALDYGAFGAPTTVAHINETPELFFGADRLELLAYCLGEKWMGPVPEMKSKY